MAKEQELRRMTRFAMKRQGLNNKFYEVEVKELENGCATMIFRWGRIGTIGQKKEQDLISYSLAVQEAEAQFEKKLGRGYEEANAMEALAAAVAEPEERKSRGMEPVEIAAPCFHAGKSEKRCQEFAAKYVTKLNLLRTSRFDMGIRAYSKEIHSLLKSYCSEWQRINKTKAHGHLVDNAAAQTAFRILFGDLKDSTKCVVYGRFEGVGVL